MLLASYTGHELCSEHATCDFLVVASLGIIQMLCLGPMLLQMKDFALRGYKSATSLAFHKAPNSALGRGLGIVYR